MCCGAEGYGVAKMKRLMARRQSKRAKQIVCQNSGAAEPAEERVCFRHAHETLSVSFAAARSVCRTADHRARYTPAALFTSVILAAFALSRATVFFVPPTPRHLRSDASQMRLMFILLQQRADRATPDAVRPFFRCLPASQTPLLRGASSTPPPASPALRRHRRHRRPFHLFNFEARG